MIIYNVAIVGLLALGFLYLYRADFEKYSVFTVGVFKRVHRRPATETEFECSEPYCSETVVDGEKRTRYKEIVLFGCPILSYGGGTLYNCESHVSFEFTQGDHTTTTERLQETIVSAIVGFAEWQTIPDVEKPNKSAFDDAVKATSATADVASVALIILPIVGMMAVLRKLE